MQTITLYKYIREDGGITISPIQPDKTDYELLDRLIADEGKELVNGDIRTACIDTDNAELWHEEDIK